jgi:hypothetical protein
MLNNSTLCSYKYSEKEKSSEKEQDFSIIFSCDSVPYPVKPPDEIFGYVSNGVRDGYQFDLSVKDVAYDYISKGKAVSPAIFIGERSQNGFMGAQSIWLDFDSKEKIITPDEVYEILGGYGIKPNIFYHTFSHTSDIPKFRYVIALDRFIRNGNAYQYLLEGFSQLFTDDGYKYLDQNCIKDISHVYFGTNPDYLHDYHSNQTYTLSSNGTGSNKKEVIYYGNNPTSYDELKLLIDSVFTNPFDRNRNGLRRVKDFDITINTHCIYADMAGNPYSADQLRVTANKKPSKPSIFKSDTSDTKLTQDRKHYIIYNSTCGDASYFSDHQVDDNSFSLSPISDYSGSEVKDENGIINPIKVRGVDYQGLLETLTIVKDFVDGRMLVNETYMNKNFDYQTLKLFTISFLRLEGGIKWMTEIMKKHKENGLNYKDEDFALLKNLQSKRYKNKYHNPNLASFSPHKEDHSYTSIYQAAKSQFKGKVEINKENLPKPLPLHKAEEQLKETFKTVYGDKKTGTMDLILAETGLGKTQLLINELNHSQSHTIIAFPTHQKKDEFACDLETAGNEKGKDFIVSPRVPDFDDLKHHQMLELLYQSGLYNQARSYINSIPYMDDAIENDINKAKEFAQAYGDFMETLLSGDFKGSVITTHKMAYHFDFDKISPLHQTFIFDEDLYSTGLISTDYLNIDQIRQLMEIDPKNKNTYKRLLATKTGIYENNLKISIRYIERQFLNCWKIKDKAVWNKMLAFARSDYFGVVKEKTRSGFVYKFLYIKKIKPKPKKKYIVLSATAPSQLYKFRGISVTIHDSCRYVEKRGKLIQYTGKSFSKQSLKKAKDLPENPDNLTVITFLSLKSLFEGASKNIHFFNSLGYNDLSGESLQVVGTPHLNPYALVLLALATGLNVNIKDENLLQKQNQMVEHNGLRFMLYAFNNPLLRNLSNQLTESELQQTVGRARLLRHDVTVHLYSNFPLWQTDEFVF